MKDREGGQTPLITRRTAAKLLGAVPLVAFAPGLAQAQTMANLAMYTGADREEKLVAGAKKEGLVSIYTSLPVDDVKVLTDGFEKKYGVKTKSWRADAETVLQRAVAERNARRYEADFFELGGREMEALHREKVLAKTESPHAKDLLPQAVLKHREWYGSRLNVFASAYNTNQVKKADEPKSYQDFLDPKWKGKLAIEAEDWDWLATVATSMGEENGVRLFKEIVAKNGISVRKGHTLLTQLVASGEVPFALTVYEYKAEQLKNNGAPIEWLALDPVVARVNGSGVAQNSQRPHAALLFLDYMLSDGQKILSARDYTPSNAKVKGLPRGLKVTFTDSAQMLDEGEKWNKLFKEIFRSGGR